VLACSSFVATQARLRVGPRVKTAHRELPGLSREFAGNLSGICPEFSLISWSAVMALIDTSRRWLTETARRVRGNDKNAKAPLVVRPGRGLAGNRLRLHRAGLGRRRARSRIRHRDGAKAAAGTLTMR
jgi:hypothetical protein